MEAKKNLILEAAYNVLIDEGIEGFSMSKIGKQAAIPKSLIFHYFANKDELILEVVEYILYKLYKNDSTVIGYSHLKENITKEVFLEYVDSLFIIDFEEKRLIQAYYACFYLGFRNEEIKSKLNHGVSMARNVHKKNFEMFAEKGIIQEDNITIAIDYILSAVAGVTKIADIEYGEQSINQELVNLHKKNLCKLLKFVE